MTALQEVASLTEFIEAAEANREPRLRLLMKPLDGRVASHRGSYRFVRELNGHPGNCGEGCFHPSVGKALDCFEGRAA